MVSVADPWQGARGVRARLLVLRGDEQAPRGFDGQVMRGDARRIVAMSSTHVAMLDALGALDRGGGRVWQAFYIKQKAGGHGRQCGGRRCRGKCGLRTSGGRGA